MRRAFTKVFYGAGLAPKDAERSIPDVGNFLVECPVYSVSRLLPKESRNQRRVREAIRKTRQQGEKAFSSAEAVSRARQEYDRRSGSRVSRPASKCMVVTNCPEPGL